MKTISIVAFLVFALIPIARADNGGSVSPSGRTLGFGLELGAPTNINMKFMVAPNQGIVVGLGGGAWYDASLSLHGDYLLHPIVMPLDAVAFSAYVGIGAWGSVGFEGAHYGYYRPFVSASVFAVGARVPLGLNLAFQQFPIELYIEAVPTVALFPGIGVFGQGGIGARFYI